MGLILLPQLIGLRDDFMARNKPGTDRTFPDDPDQRTPDGREANKPYSYRSPIQ